MSRSTPCTLRRTAPLAGARRLSRALAARCVAAIAISSLALGAWPADPVEAASRSKLASERKRKKGRRSLEARDARTGDAPPAFADIAAGGEGASDLDVWQDPEFRAHFLGSYGVNAEIEPRLSRDEREAVQEVLPLLSEDLEAAGEALEELATAEASALFDFTLGNVRFQLGDLRAASGHYRDAIEKFPSYRRAHANLGVVLVRLGEVERAAKSLGRVIQLGGADGLTYGLLGYSHAALGRHLSAESAYRNAVLLQPDVLDWRMGLAQSVLRQRKHGEAVTLLEELLSENPERTDLWMLQANAWLGLEKPLEAAKNLELVHRMGGSTVDGLLMLGDIHVNREAWSLAADAYARASEIASGEEAEDLLRRVEILAQRGALPAAESLLATVKEAHSEALGDERRKELLKIQARLAVARGEGGEAVPVLEEIVQLDPLDGEALLLLGQHHAREGEHERAVFLFERAAGLDEHEAEAKLRKAQVLVEQRRYSEAVPLLERSQEIQPRDDVARYLEQVERIARASR